MAKPAGAVAPAGAASVAPAGVAVAAGAASGGRADGGAVLIRGDKAAFSPRKLMQLYLAGEHKALAEALLAVLEHFGRRTRTELLALDQEFIDSLAENLLYYLAKPDFAIGDEHAGAFLTLHPVVANLVALSSFRTTDPHVGLLLSAPGHSMGPGQLAKLLTLYNVRCRVAIEQTRLFDASPALASLWWSQYFLGSESYADPVVWRNIRRHVAALDDRYGLAGQSVVVSYFRPSYIEPKSEPLVRGRINRAVRDACRDTRIRNRSAPGRLAVVTSRWHDKTSVYRSIYPYIRALADGHDLTLVHLATDTGPEPTADVSLFADVRTIPHGESRVLDVRAVADNDFAAAYFVDVGLVESSIYLANLRLAPIQITGYGHPVSTFSPEMDYLIGGAEVELADHATENYSERLVLIPGIGALPVWPDFPGTGPIEPAELSESGAVLVNCPWAAMKANQPLLSLLRQVIDRCERRVVFQFFPGQSAMERNAFLPFLRDLQAALGAEHVKLHPGCGPQEYMAGMAEGALSIDPFPFGGYNTIVDSLYLHKPVVCCEGTRFPSRCAAAVLRRVGLDELIAASHAEYVEAICRLVDDPSYRAGLAAHLADLDLKARLVNPAEAEGFRRAVDYLLENHQQLQAEGSREPIVIA